MDRLFGGRVLAFNTLRVSHQTQVLLQGCEGSAEFFLILSLLKLSGLSSYGSRMEMKHSVLLFFF